MLEMRFAPSPPPLFTAEICGRAGPVTQPRGPWWNCSSPLDTREVYLQPLVNLLALGCQRRILLCSTFSKPRPRFSQGKAEGKRSLSPFSSEVLNPKSDFFPSIRGFMWKKYPSSCFILLFQSLGFPPGTCGCRELRVPSPGHLRAPKLSPGGGALPGPRGCLGQKIQSSGSP